MTTCVSQTRVMYPRDYITQLVNFKIFKLKRVWKWLVIAYLPGFPLSVFSGLHIYTKTFHFSPCFSFYHHLFLSILENYHITYDFSTSLENCLCSKAQLHSQVKCCEGSQCIKHSYEMEWSRKGALALSVCTSVTLNSPFFTS